MTAEDDDFEVREAGLRQHLRAQAEAAIALRSKDREFHGLEREFIYHQAQMLTDFKKSTDVKHPRDVGDAREQILQKFLTTSGLLPSRYAVSDRSTRVVSKTGHLSNEIDIALYDRLDSVSLMNREDAYQVLPLESVYGVIQVKSRLRKREIRDGLANLASFKALTNSPGRAEATITVGVPKSDPGFGLLFAYASDLKWMDMLTEIEALDGTALPREACSSRSLDS
jgi:hypothetical protein